VVRRVAVLGILVATCVLVQATVFSSLRFGGIQPSLVLLAVVALALTDGPITGAVFGFAGGLASDLLGSTPVGLSAIVLSGLGYGLGSLKPYLVTPSPLVPMALTFAASLAGLLGFGFLAAMLNVPVPPAGFMLRAGLLGSAYNMLLTPFVFPLVRELSSRLRPQRIEGW